MEGGLQVREGIDFPDGRRMENRSRDEIVSVTKTLYRMGWGL